MVEDMKRSIGVLFGTLAAAAVLAACNNNNNGGINPPTPGPNCGPGPASLEQLYPKPNARGVSPNVAGVVIAVSSPLPSGNMFDFQVVQSNGSVSYTSNTNGGPVYGPGSGFYSISASQIPNPHATPTYPNPVYYATSFTIPIGPLQTVNLYWNDAGTQCTPNVVVGSFSTK
jgi:hypothetical protein